MTDDIGRFYNKLIALQVNAAELIAPAVDDCATFVRDDARLRCPVDTGELRRSINARTDIEGDKAVGEVYTNQEYAPYVEFGTGQAGEETNTNPIVSAFRQDWTGVPARPYLYPALIDNKEQLLEYLKLGVQKALRGL